MKRLRKAVLTSLGLLPFIAPMDIALAEAGGETGSRLTSTQELPWRKARLSLEVQTGSRTLGTLDAMVPFMGNDDFMVYADLMAKIGTGASNTNGNAFEGNFGLGVRRVNDHETAIYGAYAFFDYLKSVNDNIFTQVTLGVERLGLTWDFRANAYLPVGTKEYTKTNYSDGKVVIDQHNLIEYLKSTTEKATTGADIEIGRTLGSQNLRGYLAAYSFGKDLTGPRVRLEYQLNEHFSLNGAVQYDKDRGAQYFLGARFSIGGAKAKNSNSIYNRMTDTVVRDVDIVTQTTEIDFTQVEKDRIWFVDNNNDVNGNGTLEHPFQYVDDAIKAAPEGAIIFVKGQTDSKSALIRDIATLKPGQLLWGGNENLYWNFDEARPVAHAMDNALLIFEGNGERQQLSGGIVTADNTGIYNFDIIADNNSDTFGLRINNSHNVSLDNISITGFESNNPLNPHTAITISGDNTLVNFRDVNLSHNDIGINISGGQANINTLMIDNSQQNGILQSGGQLNAETISVTNSGATGILQTGGSIYTNRLTAVNNAGSGISSQHARLIVKEQATTQGNAVHGLFADSTMIEITKLISQNNLDTGLVLQNSDTTLSNVDISSNQLGVNVTGGSLVLTGGTIRENLSTGINATNATLYFNQVTIDSNAQDGVILDGAQGSLNAIDSAFSNNGMHGLLINNNASAIVADSTFTNNGAINRDQTPLLDQLYSAILIDSGKLDASHITVTQNAAGIELRQGSLLINANAQTAEQRTTISDNSGYGIWAHTTAETKPDITIYNTDINNTSVIAGQSLSGHGIHAEDVNQLQLFNVSLQNNAGHGIWVESGSITGDNIALLANGKFALDTEESTLSDYTYGMRIDQKANTITDVNLNNITITDSNVVGLLVDGGKVTLNNLISNKNNIAAMLTNGELTLSNAQIIDSLNYGIFLRNYIYGTDAGTRILNLENSTISGTKNGNPDNNKGAGHAVSGSGFGIAVDHDSTVNIKGTKIINNEGIGIYVKAGTINIGEQIEKEISGPGESCADNSCDTIIKGNGKSGIYYDVMTKRSASLNIYNTSVSSNGESGIISSHVDTINLNNVLIESNGNTSAFNSAGLVLAGRTTGTITNTTIRNNKDKSIFDAPGVVLIGDDNFIG